MDEDFMNKCDNKYLVNVSIILLTIEKQLRKLKLSIMVI